MTLNFKNRIAFQYLLATALIIAFVFGIVYFIVKSIVYENIDHDLSYEANKHSKEIIITRDSIRFAYKKELEEREHREAQVNPVFIQIVNASGLLMDKSPNLKEQVLQFAPEVQSGKHFNSSLNNEIIRQVQLPVDNQGKTSGYILAAMSLKASISVLSRLKNVLLVSYPVILLGLFFISRYVAGRSIVPVKNIIETTKKITQNNLKERVPLPALKDELFDLSTSINDLLGRIQKAFARERQFTSDASHELRTPLSSVQGNLEVLIRKIRKPAEYEQQIKYCLAEIDKMSMMVEQLLLLARLDNQPVDYVGEYTTLDRFVNEILLKYEDHVRLKSLSVQLKNDLNTEVEFPRYHSTLILENIINNAIKYSKRNGTITITLKSNMDHVICIVEDEGMGIKKEDVGHIFTPFFRSGAMEHKNIQGNGVGLSIALKAANAIGATLAVDSNLGKGTKVTVAF